MKRFGLNGNKRGNIKYDDFLLINLSFEKMDQDSIIYEHEMKLNHSFMTPSEENLTKYKKKIDT
jgi:hypothetical protein